jgi:prepilin-type N-terminal cleavage/methylation domain-containing protein
MSRKGFTIIEAAVALVLLSIGASALGAILLRASRTAVVASSTVQATALMNSEVSRLNALPFDSMATGTSCVTVSTPPYPHTRCTTVNNLSSKVHEVNVIVTPSGNALMRPDTVKFRRSKAGGNDALNTP